MKSAKVFNESVIRLWEGYFLVPWQAFRILKNCGVDVTTASFMQPREKEPRHPARGIIKDYILEDKLKGNHFKFKLPLQVDLKDKDTDAFLKQLYDNKLISKRPAKEFYLFDEETIIKICHAKGNFLPTINHQTTIFPEALGYCDPNSKVKTPMFDKTKVVVEPEHEAQIMYVEEKLRSFKQRSKRCKQCGKLKALKGFPKKQGGRGKVCNACLKKEQLMPKTDSNYPLEIKGEWKRHSIFSILIYKLRKAVKALMGKEDKCSTNSN